MKSTVLILSGGLDSTTLLFYLLKHGYDIFALTFNYGQKQNKEVQSAKAVTELMKINQKVINLSELGEVLTSALTNQNITIPSVPAEAEYYESLKVTVVPYRNAIFLSVAIGYAISMGISNVFYGAHHSDKGVYPDCRSSFVKAFENAARIGTDENINIKAPFIRMTKKEIVELGHRLTVPFDQTWSCYKGGDFHCGICSACRERKSAFLNASIFDPTVYLQ